MGTPTEMRIVDGVMYIEAPGTATASSSRWTSATPTARWSVRRRADRLRPAVDDRTRCRPTPSRRSPTSARRPSPGSSSSTTGSAVDTAAATKMLQNLPSSAGDRRRPLTYDLWLDSQEPHGAVQDPGQGRQRRDRDVLRLRGQGRNITAPDPSDDRSRCRATTAPVGLSRAPSLSGRACCRACPSSRSAPGPWASGTTGREASIALSRARMSVISAGFT